VERWHATSTLTPKVRAVFRGIAAKAGRWLAERHPDLVEPAGWSRQTCAAWVAAGERGSGQIPFLGGQHVDDLAELVDRPVQVCPPAGDLDSRVGRGARCLLGRPFSPRPPAEPGWLVSEHPAPQ
jgi:hypothetical protein